MKCPWMKGIQVLLKGAWHLNSVEETSEAPRRRQEPDGLGGYGHRPPPTRTGDHLLDKELFRAQEGKGG